MSLISGLKKQMSKQALGWIVGVFVLFPLFLLLYNKITVRKNDGKKYFNDYFSKIKSFVLSVPSNENDNLPNVEANYDSYRKGASPIGFKGLMGDIQTVTFYDVGFKKFFIIYLLDVDYQKYANMRTNLRKKKLFAYLNQDDLNNTLYGTKAKPIPVFNFRGVNEPIRITSESEGSVNGYETLEPNDSQYKHNVLTYLTYIMPKDEFKKRFEKK